MRGIWEATGGIWKHLEAPGGGIWRRHLEASGRHLEASGGIWRHLEHLEASAKHLEASVICGCLCCVLPSMLGCWES